MAYSNINRRAEESVKQDDTIASKRFVIERKPDATFFYELEEAVVLDVILDENHPEVQPSQLVIDTWPPNIDGSKPVGTDKDYSWIGRIRFRFLNSQQNTEKNTLDWAFPMENTGIVEYPLMNEIVIVGKYREQYFYTRKLNVNSTVNANADFSAERTSGQVERNINTYSSNEKYAGQDSKMNFGGGADYTGILGSYFKFNPKIRGLRAYEGDTILQSRFGSSIRFGAYDNNRGNDNGNGDYSDGGGNPMILIRNRQSPVVIPQGKTGKGYTIEDINKDGSSIHITSGKTKSRFVPPTSKPIISGKRPAKDLPRAYDGDQIIINSDRIILSSKANEMLFFSKKRLALVSDEEITLDCIKRMTITSMKTITLSSRKIYLGDHAKPYQPALLGRSTVDWLSQLCDWLLLNINLQIQILITTIAHFHFTKVGPTTPAFPPAVILWGIQLQSLISAQIVLKTHQLKTTTLMSPRVFVSGGPD